MMSEVRIERAANQAFLHTTLTGVLNLETLLDAARDASEQLRDAETVGLLADCSEAQIGYGIGEGLGIFDRLDSLSYRQIRLAIVSNDIIDAHVQSAIDYADPERILVRRFSTRADAQAWLEAAAET